MTSRYTLSKNERLKSLKVIRNLFEHGQKFKTAPLIIYHHFHEMKNSDADLFPLKMGVSVGAKYFRKAVDRNLLKRRMREAFRQQKLPLQQQLMESNMLLDVFFVYAHASISEYNVIWDAMKVALEKLSSILEQNHQQ
ncbi:MAG: ribonuclease protein component [Bacteroidota bacterium]|jgi:ribonuclease P protein component|nr:ribonuclease P protein component [Chitinophagia bacterium]